jgi:hypothetical protein
MMITLRWDSIIFRWMSSGILSGTIVSTITLPREFHAQPVEAAHQCEAGNDRRHTTDLSIYERTDEF